MIPGCSPCPTGCSSCSSLSCFTALPGYFIDGSSTIVSCTTGYGPNCLLCDLNFCTACDDSSFALNDPTNSSCGTCDSYKNVDIGMAGCLTC